MPHPIAIAEATPKVIQVDLVTFFDFGFFFAFALDIAVHLSDQLEL
jgi:hypothetical protein